MDEIETQALRDAFAEELRVQGLLLPAEEQDLIVAVCVSRYLAEALAECA